MGLLTVGKFLEENQERLSLRLVAGSKGLDNRIISLELNRPGLVLSGFVDLFTFNRIQVIGNTEILYLNMLPTDKRIESFQVICQFDLPCIMFTNGTAPCPDICDICDESNIPLLVTSMTTTNFVHLLSYYLEDIFAPSDAIHGTLMDVYGIGMLFIGRPGIGKSEVSLDLVERGHRLVADDMGHIGRKSRRIIVGTRVQKRIEVEVNLIDWDPNRPLDRTGLEEKVSTILDVDIPKIEVPIYPGKYVAVIVESIALNHLLKTRGYNAAEALAKHQIDLIKENERGLKR